MKVSNTTFAFFNSQAAFYCLLKAFGIGKCDRVLIPGYTGSFIPETICYTAATPEYADIDPQNYNSLLLHYQETYERMQVRGLATSLSALLIQHTFGSPNPDTEKIVSWAQKKNLLVIEYCSYAPQFSKSGKALGTSGDAAFFDFGAQGIAQVNNPRYLNIMAAMEKVAPPPTMAETAFFAAAYFRRHLLKRSRYLRLATQYFTKLNLLSNLTRGSAGLKVSPRDFFRGVSRVQFQATKHYAQRFETITSYKKHLAAYYTDLLRKHGLPVYDYQDEAILSYYPVRIKRKQECLLKANAAGLELGNGFVYPPHNASDDNLNCDEPPTPYALRAAQEVVCLPLHEHITLPYAEQLVNLLDCLTKAATYDIVGTPLQSGYRILSFSECLSHVRGKATQSLRKFPWFGFKYP